MIEPKAALRPLGIATAEVFLVLQGLTLLFEAPSGAVSFVPSYTRFMPFFDLLSDWTVGGWLVSLVHLAIAAVLGAAALAVSAASHKPLAGALKLFDFTLLAAFLFYITGLVLIAYGVGALPPFWHSVVWRFVPILVSLSIVIAAYRYAPHAAVIGRLRRTGQIFSLALVVLLPLPIALGVRIIDYRDFHPSTPPHGKAPPTAPNIMLILLDALTIQKMSLHGNSTPTTPNLDRMAAQATVFDRYTAVSNFTTTTVATILSGVEPDRHRLLSNGSYFASRPDFKEEYLLPQVLHAAGYETISVATNPLAHPLRYRIENGFDVVDTPKSLCRNSDYLGLSFLRTDLYFTLDLFPTLRKLHERILDHWECGVPNVDRFPPGAAYSDALAQLQNRPDPKRPFFIFVHTFPPHAPYLPPRPFLQMFDGSSAYLSEADYHEHGFIFSHEISDGLADSSGVRVLEKRYEEQIRYADFELEKFLVRARAAGLLNNTIVIITADHGETFRNWVGHNGPLMNQSLLSIPLIMMGNPVPQGRRIEARVSEADLAPTILDLAHLQIPDQMTGRSLSAYMHDKGPPPSPVYAVALQGNSASGPFNSGSFALIDQDWKYIQYLDRHREHLFNLQLDPMEQHDLATEDPGRLKQMRAALEKRYAGEKVPFRPN